jgi:SAM-dependent MidA family methyltransferase
MSHRNDEGSGGSRPRLHEEVSPLEELLKARIISEGPITYEAFVEMALYDERFGYYRSGKQDNKDYYTASEIHPIFGRAIGRYVEEFCLRLGASMPTIIELGGASGRLARAVISGFNHLEPDRYFIIENGAERKEDRIRWISSVERLPPPPDFAFVLANEFFDALPFHRITQRDGVLQEMYVTWDGGFSEVAGPATEKVESFLDRHPIVLPEGQSIEVTTCGVPLVQELSSRIPRGCFLLFDYGYHSGEIEQGRFPNGSGLGYRKRRINPDLFADVGMMDITHHVNFDHLAAIIEDDGWRKEGEIEQHRFLFNAGITDEFSRLSQEERLSAKWLIHPETMGSMISVLGFSKRMTTRMPGFGRRE